MCIRDSWNPSEIIGSNPRPLDYSLYRAIITHRAWNQGIARIGFRKLEEDLMHRVGNKPYICLEYAFYSLIPQAVDEELALRLVRYYQDALRIKSIFQTDVRLISHPVHQIFLKLPESDPRNSLIPGPVGNDCPVKRIIKRCV